MSESQSNILINLNDVDYYNNPASNLYEYVIYLPMAVIGIFGNIVTCLVIFRNKSLHTTINCYLFNLAIPDLIVLIEYFPSYEVLPFYQSDFLCKARYNPFFQYRQISC